MDLKNKVVTVVGLGRRTGVETVKFLAQKGAEVIVTDVKLESELSFQLEELSDYKIKFDLGGHSKDLILKSDLIVVSPGVSLNISILQEAKRKDIRIISEIELAYKFNQAPIISITGTNGKTTTTTLVGKIFSQTSKRTIVGGNIGRPLIMDLPYLTKEDLVVAEISSFQLEAIEDFRPKVSLVLNLTPDHLNRHGTFKEYIRCKRRMLINQTEADYTVLNYDDRRVREFSNYTAGQVIFFSQKEVLGEGIFIKDGWIISNLMGREEKIISVEEIGIKGPHNLENTLGAVVIALLLGVKREILVKVLREFKGVEHRIEDVVVRDGIRYINDSKGTNPVATIKALETFDSPIILIAGGMDKGSDFNSLVKRIVEKVKELILLGETADKIDKAVKDLGYDSTYYVESIEEAVSQAKRIAKTGDIVLLSPACASWDMFDSYEERGRLFKEAVMSDE